MPMADSPVSPSRVGGFKLRSLQDGREFVLPAGEALVGREVECGITLDSGHISRYHAKITVVNQDVIVEDLRSTNGTFINGRRITAPQTLSVGDEVRFHEMSFRLVSSEQGSGDADATVFQGMDTRIGGVVEAPAAAGRPAPRAPEPEEEEDGTRLLSGEDLDRLQGKAERISANVDHGSGPRLVMLTAPIRGKVFSLLSRNRNAWVIGRGSEADFQVSDRTVSALHARIRKLGDEWVLESCEGRNPIFINNRAVEFTSLHPGDVVRVGRMELLFRTDEKKLGAASKGARPRLAASTTNIALLAFGLIVLGVVIGIILM